MTCLSTTAGTIDGCVEQALSQQDWIDAVELRADLLAPLERRRVSEFPRRLASVLGCSAPTIFAVRRPVDGGKFEGSENERIELLVHAARRGAFAYLDIEMDISDDEGGRQIAKAAADGGAAVIRSLHDFTGVPENLVELMSSAARRDDDVIKCAVSPTGVKDVVRLLRMSRHFDVSRAIVIGMGPYGTITRVLTPYFGSILTFASCPGEQAAPGHLTPQVLAEIYHRRTITADTPIFAVIGSPIEHSRSPHYHNTRFITEGIEACYVPVLVDDIDAFFELAEELPILGFSVTIPHKEAALERVDELSPEAVAAKAVNTVVARPGGGWSGTNTDIDGFLQPTVATYGRSLRNARTLVIGAGGAARGVVYGLVSCGASVVLTNRTTDRATQLAADIAQVTGRDDEVVVADIEEASKGEYAIVAQTTSVGMNGDGDAAPWYEFTGSEVVFDAVYTPPETPFIKRAQAAGCRVVTGDRMFDGQAEAQFEIYREKITDAVDA